jgi:hypothetical protein
MKLQGPWVGLLGCLSELAASHRLRAACREAIAASRRLPRPARPPDQNPSKRLQIDQPMQPATVHSMQMEPPQLVGHLHRAKEGFACRVGARRRPSGSQAYRAGEGGGTVALGPGGARGARGTPRCPSARAGGASAHHPPNEKRSRTKCGACHRCTGGGLSVRGRWICNGEWVSNTFTVLGSAPAVAALPRGPYSASVSSERGTMAAQQRGQRSVPLPK